jgi:threonylcarbamoyladenosine tRNA methylthiotransferase MtaB
VTDAFIDVLADSPRICPHLHLSLQSGSDRVLARMRRRYRVAGFLNRVDKIRRKLDNPAFTTDVIVGFPGETEQDFQATCRLLREVGFSKMHIFPFSARRGTSAATMPDQVPPDVRRQRAARLEELQRALTQQYLSGLVGRELQVLVERPILQAPRPSGACKPRAEQLVGTACRYVPVRFDGASSCVGQLVPARAETAQQGWIAASALPLSSNA